MENRNADTPSLGMLLLEKAYGKWWMMLIEGIGLLVLGGLTLFWPGVTLPILVMAFGIYRVAMGLTYILCHFIYKARFGVDGGFSVGRGILDLLIGGMFLLMPGLILTFFSMIVGFFSITIGITITAIGFRTEGWWKAIMVVLGILLAAFGFFAFWSPIGFAAVFLLILGVLLGFMGIFTITRSLSMRKALKQIQAANAGFTDYKVE